MKTKEYGVRWQEFNRSDQLIVKEKVFKTEAARDRFIAKRSQDDKFHAVYAYLD